MYDTVIFSYPIDKFFSEMEFSKETEGILRYSLKMKIFDGASFSNMQSFCTLSRDGRLTDVLKPLIWA